MVRQLIRDGLGFAMTEVLSSDMKVVVLTDMQDGLLDDLVIHMHSFWELIYVFDGSAKVSCDTKAYRINKNEMLLIPPFQYHMIEMEEDAQARRIQFSFEKMKSQSKSFVFDEVYSAFPAQEIYHTEAACVGTLLKKLYENHESEKIGKESRIQASVVELLFTLYDLLKIEGLKGFDPLLPQHGYWEYRCAVETLLCRHFVTDISQEELCNLIGISTPSLTRILSLVYGDSFGNLKLELKIRNAKRMIRETDLSIGEIGKRCGYTSARGFLIAFRRYEHCTPSEYRRKKKSEK